MSHNKGEKVKIKSVTGDKDNEVLKDCYFHLNSDGTYDFCLENLSTPLATGISSGSAFTFPLGTFSWVIPNPTDPAHPLKFTVSGTNTTATGSYLNNDRKKVSIRGKKPSDGDDVTGESGTFTAQSGSTISPEEEAASAASA
jgi:hypothetical protein